MPLDFSRTVKAYFGAFGVTVTRPDESPPSSFVGVLLKRNSESVNSVGLTQIVETWHLLVRPADAPLNNFETLTVPDGRSFKVQSHLVNADGIWEYALSKA